MTVEELNIKITADAGSFKNEIAAANQAMTIFKNNAVNAGKSVTDAFSGLVTTEVLASQETVQSSSAEVPDTVGKSTGTSRSSAAVPSGIPSSVPSSAISSFAAERSYSRAASVPELESSETLIGAVAGAGSDQQPVNITTTVELDGDKVGESVNTFNMRRNKITNGLYG